jgi:hypothetical protein
LVHRCAPSKVTPILQLLAIELVDRLRHPFYELAKRHNSHFPSTRSEQSRYRDGKLVVAVTPSPRSRVPRAAIAALAIVLVALGILGFVSCSGDDSSKPHASGSTTVPSATKKVHALKIGTVRIESVGPPLQLSKGTRKAVLASAQQYVDTGVYGPLDSGAVASGYAALFESPIRSAATTADRGALTEVPVGKAKKYSAKASPVAVSGLVDGSGALVFLATNFRMEEKVTTASGPLRILRNVELTFVPNGKQWRVTAYRVVATRKTAVATTTTTARTARTTTP